MKKILQLILGMAVALLTFTNAAKVYAESDVDILLRKFVERGIVSSELASEIKEEIKAEKAGKYAEKVPPEGIEERVAALEEKQSGTANWADKIKLKGDFRLRYESRKRKGRTAKDKGRVRYRVGIISDIVDQVQVGAGLASGSDSSTSSRSTNVDLQDAFATKSINLDYAYAEYAPTDWVSIIGGKFKRKKYLWEPGDLLWDTDINPEGGSLQFKHKLTDWAKATLNTGVWILDESSPASTDPYMYYFQPMVTFKDKESKIDVKLAYTYYNFAHVQGKTLDDTEGTNTLDSSGLLLYRFTPFAFGGELGYKEPFDLDIPRIAVFGEYVNNTAPDDENHGWLMGVKLGDKKVNDKNKWQLKYIFANLQRDAFPDAFPDADRYEGETDVRSHEGIAQLGLNKNVMVELDYYQSRRINATKNPENLFQASANFKF